MSIDLQPVRVRAWLRRVWPSQIMDVEERALRFLEESIELAEALGITKGQAHRLIHQVFDKGEPGQPMQELGGVTVTLASLCEVAKLNADEAFETEFARCEQPETIEKIQRKHLTKAVVSSRQRPDLIPTGYEPIYGEDYSRSVKKSHRAEGNNFVD